MNLLRRMVAHNLLYWFVVSSVVAVIGSHVLHLSPGLAFLWGAICGIATGLAWSVAHKDILL